jgi:hypothetical protein
MDYGEKRDISVDLTIELLNPYLLTLKKVHP